MNTIELTKELSQNFLDFSHEVNYQRAFADARDGLKPGQRACLWEMYQKGYKSSKPHVKSAKISGGVIANWWPHGDTAVYETFARMSQKWINNIPEIDWHGANGSVQISGEPAASRYTEARLTKLVEEGMLFNINKKNVAMKSNFSDDDEWPVVFPSIFPRLMVNGCQGIGSTIANVWLPHCFTEVAEIIKKYIDTKQIDYNNIAPSFPSGGIIINKDNLSNIYKTGKGKVVLRGKAEIKNNIIIITEIPYQVYVEPLIEEIKKYAEEEKSGIENVVNKSSKNIHIEVECSIDPWKILNQLYLKTNLQKTFNANQYALTERGVPALLTLENYLDIYINHNISCILKETHFDLDKALNRLEIVKGLLKALEDIDNIIILIKQSDNAKVAKENLIFKYSFTENQANAILAMKLSSLAKLEKIELNKEAFVLQQKINNLNNILKDKEEQKNILKARLQQLVNKYSDKRRTELTQIVEPKDNEEKKIAAIPPEKCVVVLTEGGDIKRISAKSFRTQRRAGKGIKTQDDITSMVLRTNTVDSLMIFTNKGNMYRLIVDDIPEGTNTSKGTPVRALVSMEQGEKPEVIYSIYRDTDAKYVVFITKQGYVKRTSLEEYIGTKRRGGIKAINLRSGDNIATVFLANKEDIIILSQQGYAIRCKGTDFPASGRTTSGYKGINLHENDEVITALPIRDINDSIAIFSKNGLGRRIKLTAFTSQSRNGRGTIYAKDANMADACLVSDGDMILICGDKSSLCIKADELPAETASKTTMGNIVIKGNIITGVSKV